MISLAELASPAWMRASLRDKMSVKLGAPGRRSRGRPRIGKAEMIESELLEGAFRAFLNNGYAGTSLSQIVKSLGISKTTLYSRFASKQELFQAIIVRQTEGITAGAVLSGGTPLALEEGLRAYATSMMELSLEGDLLQINRLIYSESHRFPELGIAAANRSEHGIRVVSGFIAECAVRDGIPCRDAAGI
ncbi:MAG TPA: helix-turn-helix domain-containing protein, partial [Acidocella sp.]|nr:helix-turn-helix domain-containing protein [Acidocella sp.]